MALYTAETTSIFGQDVKMDAYDLFKQFDDISVGRNASQQGTTDSESEDQKKEFKFRPHLTADDKMYAVIMNPPYDNTQETRALGTALQFYDEFGLDDEVTSFEGLLMRLIPTVSQT